MGGGLDIDFRFLQKIPLAIAYTQRYQVRESLPIGGPHNFYPVIPGNGPAFNNRIFSRVFISQSFLPRGGNLVFKTGIPGAPIILACLPVGWDLWPG